MSGPVSTDGPRMAIYRAELAKLEARHGTLTAEIVRDAAVKKTSPLHDWFTWDKDAASLKWQLEEARRLIRYVTVTVTERSVKVTVPYYVRDPKKASDQPGYIGITSDELNRRDATTIIAAEVTRCENSIARARGMAEVLSERFPGLDDDLEQALASLLRVKVRLEEASQDRSRGAEASAGPAA